MSAKSSPKPLEDQGAFIYMSEPESIDEDAYDSDSQRPTEEQKQAREKFIGKMWEVYNAGTKLFTKEMITQAQKQLSTFPLNSCIHIPGFDGEIHEIHLLLGSYHEGEETKTYVPKVRFEPFERFVFPSPLTYRPESENPDMCAVVSGSVYDKDFNRISDTPVETVAAAFDRHCEAWLQSDTRKGLDDLISSTRLPPVDKIIAFGLGSISPIRSDRQAAVKRSERRSCAQHGMVMSLARLIERQYGGEVACYVQDPAYFDTCKNVLSSRGVTVLEPEEGFVLLDERTLVVSIHPNIPVRQVIADLGRPAVMIWDRIDEDCKVGKWKKMKSGGLLSPFSTDPTSPRVKALLHEYAELPFPKDERNFGDLCVYIRKEGVES